MKASDVKKWLSSKAPIKEPKRILNPEEEKALASLQAEAAKKGVHLQSGGKGGLPPSLVLGIFRRDNWQCVKCGSSGMEENGGLTVHHRGGAPVSTYLKSLGKVNSHENLASLCKHCHHGLHDKARGK